VAERGVFRRAGGREEPERLQGVQTDELVMAETDLRATEQEVEDRTHAARQPRRPRGEAREPGDAPALTEEPRDRDADEDGRLLDGAHAAAHVEAVHVGEGERHTLVGEVRAPGEP